MSILPRSLLATGLSLALTWPAFSHAQEADAEPNGLCASAALVGPASGFATTGELSDASPDARLQFFRFEAEPGAMLEATLQGQSSGRGSLRDPLLGLFGDDCRLIAVNDDYRNADSRLRFEVPADGAFVIAAAAYPDFGFTGEIEGNAGTYELGVGAPPPSIGSITVRLFDPVFGAPVPGDRDPYANATLYRCERDCDEYVTGYNANGEGTVRFTPQDLGDSLAAGTYLIRAAASGYSSNESGRFSVGDGEDLSVGDLPLFPPAFSIGAVEGCGPLPPQGGICRYRAELRNATDGPFSGLAWSLVDSYDLGSPNGRTSFEASVAGAADAADATGPTRVPVFVDSLSSAVVEFEFEVPSFLADGTTFCQSLYLGVDPRPLYATVARSDLFCVAKIPGGFSKLTGAAMAKAAAGIDARSGESRSLEHGLSPAD